MMNKRNKLKLALALNIVLTLLEINILCYRILTAGMEVVVLRFQYFSYYSNFLILISSIAMVVSLVNQIRGKRERISYGVRLLRYMSVSAEVLTTFVVVFFLLPPLGLQLCLQGALRRSALSRVHSLRSPCIRLVRDARRHR